MHVQDSKSNMTSQKYLEELIVKQNLKYKERACTRAQAGIVVATVGVPKISNSGQTHTNKLKGFCNACFSLTAYKVVSGNRIMNTSAVFDPVI
jgi:hypothetical protein